jgi:nuclear transport factor 2 (NTF2) superfamily protein
MNPPDATRRWAETWKTAWEALDPEPVVALYAPDAVHWTEPFREPGRGRDTIRAYVERVFAEEEDVRVWIGEPILDRDRAAIAWWASLREEGRDTTLAGVSLIRFGGDGLVLEQWDAWNHAERRVGPPPESPLGDHDT